jgi:biopolymer transport protein ExbD
MAGGGEGEPDLTAMLDVVMQLLMYFIMCVRFGAEEVPTGTIALPNSQAAKPIVKSEGEMLFVNVMPDGKVVVLNRDPMNMTETELWLGNRAMDAKSKAKDGKIQTSIVLRADKGTSYADVYRVLEKCKKQGFTKFKVRANTGGAAPPGGGH